MYTHTHTHIYIYIYIYSRHTQNSSYVRSFWNRTLTYKRERGKGTDNEETNLRTLGIYAIPTAYICVMYHKGLEI